MLKIVNEGLLDIFVKSNETLTQGQLVKLSATGIITVAGAGDNVHGIVAQDVISGGVNNFKLDSVTHKAYIGDKVGVYIQDGVYITDQYSGNITPAGTKLYAGANGKLVATASGNVIATALTTGNSASGNTIRIKFEQ